MPSVPPLADDPLYSGVDAQAAGPPHAAPGPSRSPAPAGGAGRTAGRTSQPPSAALSTVEVICFLNILLQILVNLDAILLCLSKID
jgi:hypothetical protein